MATGIPPTLRYLGVYGLMEVSTSQLPQDEGTKATSLFVAALPWVAANSMMASPHKRLPTLAFDLLSSGMAAFAYFKLKQIADDRQSAYRMGRVTNGAVIGGGAAAAEQAMVNLPQLLHGEGASYRLRNVHAYFFGFVAGTAVTAIKELLTPVKSSS